jgi:hypothetical protein
MTVMYHRIANAFTFFFVFDRYLGSITCLAIEVCKTGHSMPCQPPFLSLPWSSTPGS